GTSPTCIRLRRQVTRLKTPCTTHRRQARHNILRFEITRGGLEPSAYSQPASTMMSSRKVLNTDASLVREGLIGNTFPNVLRWSPRIR
ncbi:unnamed protein product, partial [Pylaiella littoralis]